MRSFMTVALGLGAALVFAVPSGFAHPTDQALREELEERAQCEAVATAEERIDPIRLGMSEQELLPSIPDLQQAARLDGGPQPSSLEQRGPVRWIRGGTEALAGVDYELWQGRVYRIRWRLPAEFERPVMDELGRRTRICFGPPEYDQTFEAKPGSPKATLRRIRWKHGDRQIELRQLHPLQGGPVYLTVTASDLLREIGAAGRVPMANPARSEPWWRRSTKPLVPATESERDRLGRRFLRYLSQLDH